MGQGGCCRPVLVPTLHNNNKVKNLTQVRIDLSNKDLVSKVSSIGSTQEPSEEELLLENENKLSEFLGNMPPIVDLKNMQRFQRENEYRQWIGLGKFIFWKYLFF